MSNVVDLSKYRLDSDIEAFRTQYKNKIDKMHHIELLESMVAFQEARSRIGQVTPKMMVEGQELFGRLESTANTPELRTLASSYRRHCDAELKAYLSKK